MENIDDFFNKKRTEKEHLFTSTGIKFWRHKFQMDSYKNKTGNTIISTHISPEGSCNLKCSYCSVSKRNSHNRIELEVIKEYIFKLKSRGLKAVILTGGGEPTLYPQFNDLVSWIRNEQNLSVALITNGCMTHKVDKEIWNLFSWVRISLNFFEEYKKIIKFPSVTNGILGCSMVYTGQNLDEMRALSQFVDNEKVKYIRILPNCLLTQDELVKEHEKIMDILSKLGDIRFFQQFKLHGIPSSSICHQAYFRPYLSEVNGGTVFPCDSLVLNDELQHFNEKYAICKSKDILDFLDGKIDMRFDAMKMCSGCVFTHNIELLDNWVNNGRNEFSKYDKEIIHEEFV